MKKVTKDNRKSYIYPAISISVVIIIFAILNLWSVGDFENYKKISEFRNGLLSKDFKFKQFPPNELFGIKLYDDFEKYLLVNKDEFELKDINNNKYYNISATRSGKDKIKSINPLPEYFDFSDTGIWVKENGELVGIIGGYRIRLKNNNNFLNVCTNTRNLFIKQHNLSKLNFKNQYYTEDADEFFDFKNFEFLIKNNNARFSIICGYDINLSSIEYSIILFLYDINLWKDLTSKYDVKINFKKHTNNDIRKYRNKKDK